MRSSIVATLCLAILAGFISADESLYADYIVGSPKPTSPFPLEYTFNVGRTELAPDGFSRRVWTVNGQFPGPPIHVFKNDLLKVNVINNLGDEQTSIHWHGIFQNATPWYDGVPGTTQCPIPIGSSLNYEFVTPTAGTFWWHSHFTAQYVDGMLGPLIVHDQNDPYLPLYDEEITVLISDWYHTESPILLQTLRLPVSQGGKETTPDAGIINGRSNYNCTLAPSGSKCTSNAPLSKFKFECGKKYRLRIINTSAMSTFKFSIDQHLLNVIEADGFTMKSYETHRISISPAQRYSVIVEAKQTPDNYFMRADFDTSNFFPVPTNLNPNVTAIVHYEGAPENCLPTTNPWDYSEELIEKDLRPFFSDTPVPSPVGKQLKFDLNIVLDPPQTGAFKAIMNNSSFVPDVNNPTLQKVLDYESISQINGSNQNVYELCKFGEVIEIVLHNLSPVTHPFHLHGHQFWTIGNGNGTYVEGKSQVNTKDAIKRDTYNVPGGGWAVIRFIADNPGVWTFHCHIEWHLELGLSIQLLELSDQLQTLKEPDDVKNLCSTPKMRKLRKRKSSARSNLSQVQRANQI